MSSRFDVAEFLENTLDVSAWKGDEHIKGVFFSDNHGHAVNKVLAVRIRHDENHAPSVFYSFGALDDDEHPKVSEEYPFQKMKVRPKKHFLLFDREEIKPPDLSKLFCIKEQAGKIKIKPQAIKDTLESISNKRERERSVAVITTGEKKMTLRVVRPQAKRKKILAENTWDCDVLEEVNEDFCGNINAHTFSYVLGIFSAFPHIILHFGRDRIMITGENDDQKPNVEVVVSQTKTV